MLLAKEALPLGVLRVQRARGWGAAAALCLHGACLPAVATLVKGWREGDRPSKRSVVPPGVCCPQPSTSEERHTPVGLASDDRGFISCAAQKRPVLLLEEVVIGGEQQGRPRF